MTLTVRGGTPTSTIMMMHYPGNTDQSCASVAYSSTLASSKNSTSSVVIPVSDGSNLNAAAIMIVTAVSERCGVMPAVALQESSSQSSVPPSPGPPGRALLISVK
eukprot:3035268-Rhodomonas_salina.1